MKPATGGSDSEHRDEREWILRCDGFQVYAGERYVGTVVAAVYDHSARWNAPQGLRVRRADGAESIVLLGSIVHVDVAQARIAVSAAPAQP